MTNNSPKATIICDMQFGSTGKGLFAGYEAYKHKPDVVMTSWMPNSGHTFVDSDGRKYVHTALANGVVSPNLRTVLIGPGSVVDVDALAREAAECADHLENARIWIHENATILSKDHQTAEAGGAKVSIGSTRKGSGAAMQHKIERDPEVPVVAKQHIEMRTGVLDKLPECASVVEHRDYMEEIARAERIQIEGAQGYSLGVNSGFYPYTTARECTPAQIMSDTLLPVGYLDRVVGVARTYPIRVANRYNEAGEMIGWSGPVYPDQREISWEDLGMEPELTTVTQLPRRIFTFSKYQTSDAVAAIRPTEIALNFAQYLQLPESIELGMNLDDVVKTINDCCDTHGCGRIAYMGWGPKESDIEVI